MASRMQRCLPARADRIQPWGDASPAMDPCCKRARWPTDHPSRTASDCSESNHVDAEVVMGGASPLAPTSAPSDRLDVVVEAEAIFRVPVPLERAQPVELRPAVGGEGCGRGIGVAGACAQEVDVLAR
jgi:hypothetical protein